MEGIYRIETYNVKEAYELAKVLGMTQGIKDVEVLIYDTGEGKYCVRFNANEEFKDTVEELIKDLEFADIGEVKFI